MAPICTPYPTRRVGDEVQTNGGASVSFFDKLRRMFRTRSSPVAPPRPPCERPSATPPSTPNPGQLTAQHYSPVHPQPLSGTGQPAPLGRSRPQQKTPVAPASTPTGYRVGRDSLWIPPGQPVTVAGQLISGGMLYVGQGLKSASS